MKGEKEPHDYKFYGVNCIYLLVSSCASSLVTLDTSIF